MEITSERLTGLFRPPRAGLLEALDAAARAGHEGALRLESFFVGQVVGSMHQLRPAGEITRQMVADCERRIAELAGLVS